jgi:hypothetical protein
LPYGEHFLSKRSDLRSFQDFSRVLVPRVGVEPTLVISWLLLLLIASRALGVNRGELLCYLAFNAGDSGFFS